MPSKSLPIRVEELTAEWLTRALSSRYPETVVTEVHIGTIIAGTATKVRLLLSYNDAGHRHRRRSVDQQDGFVGGHCGPRRVVLLDRSGAPVSSGSMPPRESPP